MAWPTVTKTEEMFKPASTVAQHKTGLKVLIYGQPDTMKTGFALSFPPPIYIFDTELGAPPLFQYFKGKEIQWCDATFLNPQTGMHDASVALQALETGIALLKDVKAGTVVIDSGTDAWDWVQEWLNEIGKHKEGQLLRFEWAKAKLKWKKLLLQLMAKPLHFVMTAQPQEIYANKEPTGTYRARIQGESAHSFDIVLHAMRWETVNPKDLSRTVRYVTEVTKCRFKKAWRPMFEDIGINGFEKLTTALKKDLGIEVW
jgi:hypothetical protein